MIIFLKHALFQIKIREHVFTDTADTWYFTGLLIVIITIKFMWSKTSERLWTEMRQVKGGWAGKPPEWQPIGAGAPHVTACRPGWFWQDGPLPFHCPTLMAWRTFQDRWGHRSLGYTAAVASITFLLLFLYPSWTWASRGRGQGLRGLCHCLVSIAWHSGWSVKGAERRFAGRTDKGWYACAFQARITMFQ